MAELQEVRNQTKSLKINLVLNVVKTFVSMCFPLITYPYITRIFSVEDVGKINFYLSIISYFQLIAGSIARALIAISIFLFGLTTSTGWFTYYSVILKHWLKNNQKVLKIAEKVFILGTPLWGLLVTVLTLYGNGTPAQLWVIADFTTVFPTFVNVATLFILSGTFFKLLKDYKARYMGIGKVDKDMALFYEDKKEKEEK